MSPDIAKETLGFLRDLPEKNSLKTPEDFKLTSRELEILEHLSTGKSYKKIAGDLFISLYTVRSHIENIYAKLAVSSKVAACQLAYENKWFGN